MHVSYTHLPSRNIAIVPTACGIETKLYIITVLQMFTIAIVPTACGIETAVSLLYLSTRM